MNTLELLKKAIELQKPISFEYNKEGKVAGKRIGNTHIVHSYKTKAGILSTKVDLFQTGGVSDSTPNTGWRWMNIQDISNVIVLEKEESFEVAEGYNPESERYSAGILFKI